MATHFAVKISAIVEKAGKVLMPVAAVVLLIGVAPDVWRLIGDGTLLAISVFVVTGFAVGHLLGGPEPEHAAVLAFSAACRHPGTALAVAAANYPDENLRAAVLIYLAVNVVVGLLVRVLAAPPCGACHRRSDDSEPVKCLEQEPGTKDKSENDHHRSAVLRQLVRKDAQNRTRRVVGRSR